ncbi:MAG: hypothetical protein IKB13_09540 [Clostridia bacterium]|nr:hypothetical protein [Clostridia bacterium]
MKKLISVLTVMLIVFASVWCMMPVMAAEILVQPENGAQDVGGCLVHDFTDWSATPTTATCKIGSYLTRTCKVCGFVDLEKVAPANPHTPVADGKYIFNEADATHTYTCAACNEVITEDCALVFVSSQEKSECEIEIINTYKCAVCEGTVEKIEAPAHKVEKWTLVPGSVQHSGVCTGCGKTVYENCAFAVVSETGDCENGGLRTSVCKCGRTSDEIIPAGHNIEAWLHIEGTSIHVGKCTTCMRSLNNECVVETYSENPITAENPVRTHTGACKVCLASYTKECTPGTYAGVAGTASHQTNCVDCGRNYTGMCSPDANGYTSNNNGSHTATCAVCASAFTAACTPTEYTHVENTKTHSTVCTECDGTYTEACEVKLWTPSQQVNAETGVIENEDLHKGNCAKCNAEYEEDCTVESYTIDVANKTCTGTCTACGDTLTHESNLGVWLYDSEKNTHTVECAVCDATASHAVAVDENGWKHIADQNGNYHETACTVCSTEVLAACEFEADATNVHKHTCKVCKYFYEDECVNFAKDKENSTAATCTEDGHTYYICKDCGVRNESKTITHKAIGHNFVVDAETEITSTEDSHTVTYICKNCNATETKTEKHKFDKTEAGKNGKHTVKCTVCEKTKTENCTAEKIPAVAADCTNTGLTEGSKCKVCGAILKEQTKTSALGHDYKFVSTTATCSKAGKDIFKCVCGEKKELNAAANGKHTWQESKRVAATASANGYIEYKCKDCTATYTEVLTYSVNTGLANTLAPVAAVVLLSGAAFVGVKKLRKDEE